MTRDALNQSSTSSAFRNLGGCISGCASVAIFLLAGLIACASAPPVPTSTAPASRSDSQTQTPDSGVTEPAARLASPSPTLALGASKTITLTIWAPEEFSPEAAQGGGVLRRQVEAFAHARPDIAVKFELKSPHGKGGLLDFLVKVQSLVPDRLPDLILIDSREVDVAARTGLLQPLDRDLPSGAFADMLSPAQTLAEHDGQWLTLPLTLDVQHLAYNTKAVSEAPATWDDLLKDGVLFAFAADDDDAFLFQYLENQGRIANSQQPAPLNVSLTTSVLTFFQRARSANLVPDSVLAIKSAHDVWPLFAGGQAQLAQVEASDYLAEHGNVPNTGFAPLPTQDGGAATLVSGWNYAIITQDANRHAAAAAFLNWIDEPSRLAEWAAAAQMVPRAEVHSPYL